MPDERGLRDRRLIERTAALLSEDYPLEQLLNRVADVLRSELDATLVFIALNSESGLRIAASSGTVDTVDVAGEATPGMRAYFSGEPVLVRSDDRVTVWSCDDAACELAVPIKYRDMALGVLSVCSGRPGALEDGDSDLLLAIARYLGIAIRNQRSRLPLTATRRSTWVIAGIVVVALAISLGLVRFAEDRRLETLRNGQMIGAQRASAVAARVLDYLQDAEQLATSAALVFSGQPKDRSTTERTIDALLRSATNSAVYGVGVWYEPLTFDGHTRFYGPYVHYQRDRSVKLTYEWMRTSYAFPTQPWYRLGISHPGRVSFTDPYFDTDAIYFTAVRSFTGDSGRVTGVVTVDSIMPNMASMVNAADLNGSIAVVTSGDGSILFTSDDAALLAFAKSQRSQLQSTWRMPRTLFDAFVARNYPSALLSTQTIEGTHWALTVYTRADAVGGESARTLAMVAAAIAALWAACAVAIFALLFARRHRRHARSLETQRHALEREIEDRLAAEERLREQAYRDELTGLPNRAFVMKHIAQAFKAYRTSQSSFALLFIDLDRFNLINDSLGHTTGDALLIEFAQRLRYALRAGDVLGRLGGDEYIIVLEDANASIARERAAAVTAVLRHPFVLSGHELFVTVSIGVAIADQRYASADEILRDADGAMYEAKRAGRSTVRVFDQSMHTRATEQLALESDLRRAIEAGDLFVEYQPIVTLADGNVAGFEALARWNHRTRGRVPPDIFIRLAEQSGTIVLLDQQIIAQASRDAMSWQREFPEMFVSVNASAAHLARIDDIAAIKSALTSSGLRPEALKVEITETAVMENGDKALDVLVHLRAMGVRLVIDDFGTGYSSLSYLQQLPVEELKIDRSFVSMMLHNEQAAEIVRAIVAVAKTLHLRVTAEGVETEEQIERLRRLGVELAQGYAFGMPRSLESAMQLLRAQRDSQKVRFESSKIVTGPSLTSDTLISAPKTP